MKIDEKTSVYQHMQGIYRPTNIAQGDFRNIFVVLTKLSDEKYSTAVMYLHADDGRTKRTGCFYG